MNSWATSAKIIIVVGLLLVVAGIIMLLGSKLGFGPWRLPGDIVLKKDNCTLYFPLATCIVLSIILSIILNIFLRR